VRKPRGPNRFKFKTFAEQVNEVRLAAPVSRSFCCSRLLLGGCAAVSLAVPVQLHVRSMQHLHALTATTTVTAPCRQLQYRLCRLHDPPALTAAAHW
jgi:hypothetical protein